MWSREDVVNSPDPRSQTGERHPADQRLVERSTMRIGATVVIKGDLSASEDLTLDGMMEGKIQVPDHMLTVGPDAKITAEVSAKIIVISGAVTGNVMAGDKVEIRETGSVQGDVSAPRLVMADGARLQGKVDMPARAETTRSGTPMTPGHAETRPGTVATGNLAP